MAFRKTNHIPKSDHEVVENPEGDSLKEASWNDKLKQDIDKALEEQHGTPNQD